MPIESALMLVGILGFVVVASVAAARSRGGSPSRTEADPGWFSSGVTDTYPASSTADSDSRHDHGSHHSHDTSSYDTGSFDSGGSSGGDSGGS